MPGAIWKLREPEHYLFCYVPRPGNAPAKQDAIGILARSGEGARAQVGTLRERRAAFSGPESRSINLSTHLHRSLKEDRIVHEWCELRCTITLLS